MKVFLSFSFDERASDLAGAVKDILSASRFDVLTGEPTAGSQLAREIQQRIDSAEILVAILTPVGEQGEISGSVREEISWALSKEKRVVIMKHVNVVGNPLMMGDDVHIRFTEETLLRAVARLVTDLRKWQDATGFVQRSPITAKPHPQTLIDEGWALSVVTAYEKGVAEAQAGAFDEARKIFSQIMVDNERCWRAVNGLAMCDVFQREYAQAISRLDAAIVRWKSVPRALSYFWHNRGWAIFRSSKGYADKAALRQAVHAYQRSLENDDANHEARLNIILSRLSLFQLDKAEKEFQEGLMHPDFKAIAREYIRYQDANVISFIRRSDWIANALLDGGPQ
jgi:tetratricopeptide (TPR) repeat protein